MNTFEELLNNPEFKTLLIEEATNLKENATEEEIKNLDINKVDATKVDSCIYGLMTGSCRSIRAVELMKEGCPRVINEKLEVNGPLSEDMVNSRLALGTLYGLAYFSAIEVYIAEDIETVGTSINSTSKARVTNLVNFLKGESETLDL